MNQINTWRLGDSYMIIKLVHHWFRYWLVTCSAPSHYPNQWSISKIVRNHLKSFLEIIIAICHEKVSCDHMSQVTKLQLSCYLVLLSIDSKTREQDSRSFVTWPISYCWWKCSLIIHVFFSFTAVEDYKKAEEIAGEMKKVQDGLKRAQKLLKQSLKRDYYKILGVKRSVYEVNSLWPSDAIWWQTSGLTLA